MNRIIASIEKLSGQRTPYKVFTDWVNMFAISIQNACTSDSKVKEKREELYRLISQTYSNDELMRMCEMSAWLTEILEDDVRDVLGGVFMRSGCGSKSTGQFFTPYHLARLTTELTIDSYMRQHQSTGKIIINEPSCGGGGMIIAAVEHLKERGINYQRDVKVIAQDLDWNGVYMTYTQLSLLGIDAVVIQGNTLENERTIDPKRVFRTPKNIGVIF